MTHVQSLLTFASKCQQTQDSGPPVETQKQLLTWTTTHGVPLHALPVGERGHVSVRVHALLHVAAPHAFGAAARALPAHRPQGAGCAALLGAVVSCGQEDRSQLSSRNIRRMSPEIERQKIKCPVYCSGWKMVGYHRLERLHLWCGIAGWSWRYLIPRWVWETQ